MTAPSSSPAAAELASEPRERPSLALAIVTLGVVAVCAGWGLLRPSVWDPAELEVAEFARRVARHQFGGELPGPDVESVPTQGELGRGELPILAVALGFRLFGLTAWAGRLPLVVVAALGLLATWVWVARLGSRRTAWLAVLVLGSCPLYYLQARVMQGDIALFASLALCASGFSIAVFDRRATAARLWGLTAGLLGATAGFWTRGAILGVAVPCLGIGGAWLCRALAGQRGDRFGTALGSALVLGGGTFAALGGVAVQHTPSNLYSVWVGAVTGGVQPAPNFDVVIRDFGHALYPWSALAVLAPARWLQRFVRAESSMKTEDRGQALWLGALGTSSVALFAQTALCSELGLLPFVALAPVAVLIALGLADLEAYAGESRGFVLAVLALTTLLLLDFRNFPEKGLVAFAVPDAVFPESFAHWGFVRLLVPSVLSLIAFFFVLEPVTRDGPAKLLRSDYATWPRALLAIGHGHVFFALLVAFFGLVAFDLLLIASDRVLHIQALQESGSMLRLFVRAAWASLLALVSLPWWLALGRDLAFALLDAGGVVQRWLARRVGAGLGVGRAASAAFCLACASLSFATAYYPALLLAMSSERAFSGYRARALAGEPLGLLGLKPELARYSAGGEVRELPNVDAALSWLFAGEQRRFLATDRTSLPSLNSARRQRSHPPVNLIVLEASSEVLLVSNQLRAGERDRNPLADIVLSGAVAPAHPLDANLGNKLDMLGWQVNDANGAPAAYITPAHNYEFVIFYRVIERLSGRWETFVHFDGFQRRYNADHPTLQGRYPFWAWLPGDLLADRHTIRLEPNFTPGRYRVFLGLYSGSRRLEVRRGAHEQDRVVAGSIEVR